MDCVTELAKEAVKKLGELVLESSLKHFKYLTQHKTITNNLEKELENLKKIKEALQTRVDTERRRGYEIEPTVQKWLSDVSNELQKWSSIEINFKKSTKCFDFPLNYSLGKQATESIENITSLTEEKNKFKDISYAKAPLTLGSIFTQDIKSLLSRNKIITDIIEKLKDDQVKMVSICGMGGVGKTTLAKELIKTVEKMNLFDEVGMAVVSQDINYENIQIQIAETLGMELKKVTKQGRAMELLDRFSEGKRVLIILDDIWDILDLECIGLPHLEHEKSCKVLFTSREERVCQNMGSKVNFQVSTLLEDEAWYLFRELTGEVVDKPDINVIAREVAKECDGLPLAIAIVGRSLSNQDRKYVWEDALRQLRNLQSSPLSEIEKSVYPSIELSFKVLGHKEHQFFLMLCGLFPEDFDIPIESLLHHALGLRLFEDICELHKARDRVHTLVGDLKKKFLLLDSNVQGCVKMHDIVRNVVISMLFKSTEYKFMVVQQHKLKSLKAEKLNDISAISMILDDPNELENDLEFPTLKLLQVRSKSKKPIFWTEHLFQGMSVLKALSMQNLCIPKFPSLSHASVNLHTLLVEYCDVGDISVIGKELKNLQVLSFAHSNIVELPVEIGNLHVLRLLDLTDCNQLTVISANVFIKLSHLEELYFRVDNFSWKRNEAAINELQNISHKLMVVEILVQGSDISVVKDLDFTNLQKFWIYVNPYYNIKFQRSSYFETNVLQLRFIYYRSLKISQLIKKCAILLIMGMDDLKNFTSQLLHDCPIPCLKDITVETCDNMEYLIDSTIHYNGFPQLKSLKLRNLENLKEICHTSNHNEVKGSMVAFSNLEKLELIDLPRFIGFNKSIKFNEVNQESKFSIENGENVSRFHSDPKNCTPSHGFAKLFSSNCMKHFPKLEEIFLRGHMSLDVVFDLEGCWKSNGQTLDLLFPRLTKIVISNLYYLSFVWGIVPYYVQGFQNLRFLTISECDSLKHVFTSTIVREITNLEKLEVRHCKSIENIVMWNIDYEKVVDDNKDVMATIGFNKLQYLSLSRLPKFVSMCSNSVELDCPSLKQFHIDGCRMLELSLLPTHINAKGHNLNATYSANTKGVDFHISKENNSRISTCSHRCMPFLTKFCHQGNTSKRNNKETSMHDHIPSTFAIKNKKGKIHMSHLEDLCISDCDLLDVLFSLDESWNKQQYMDEYVGDHIRIRHYPLIDGSLFPNLTSLLIKGCDKINILFSHSSISSLQHLRELKLRYCENVEEIISCQEGTEASENKILFCALQHLLLENLPNLKAFFQGHYDLEFPSLQKVLIKDCPTMEVFSRGVYDTPKLESLTIEIKSMKNVCTEKIDINVAIQGIKAFVASQGFKMMNWKKLHKEGYKSNEIYFQEFNNLLIFVSFDDIKMLQHVKELSIYSCDSLVEVFESGKGTKKGDDIIHHELQQITLFRLPKLNHIWKHNITEVVSFKKLKFIYVRFCHNLKNLVSHSIAGGLEQLEELDVKQCDMMEEIITKEDEIIKGGNKVKILFPKLNMLTLHDLPNLECVCSGDYDYDLSLCTVGEDNEINNNEIQISFPNLNELVLNKVPKLKCFSSGMYDYNIMVSSIKECPNMKTFPHGNVVVKTPNLHKIEWDGTYREIHGDLNLAIHYIQNKEKYMDSITFVADEGVNEVIQQHNK